MQMREKVGKSRNIVFFQWFEAPEGPKVGSLKRRVRSQLARWEMKNCTPLWREAHVEVKMYKTLSHHSWKLRCRKSARSCGAKRISKSKCTKHTTFGSWDVEKVHAVVARSTFPSQNVQNTSAPDHFWKLRCRKSARRCGAKHISKSKCTKHHMFAPLLEVRMLKKCTPLWREAHFQVKMYKTPHVRATFWRFRCRFAASLHYTTLRYITPHSTILHYITLHYTPQHYNYNYTTRLHSTTLHYIEFHYTTLHYTTLHYTILHSTTLHYTTLRSTTLQLQLHNYTPLHSTTLNYTTLHYTTLHYTTLHYTTLHSTTLHYTTLHSTTLQLRLHNYTPLQLQLRLHNYTPLHEITLHYTTLHYTTLHSTTLHYTTLHYTTLQYTEWHCATDRQVDR